MRLIASPGKIVEHDVVVVDEALVGEGEITAGVGADDDMVENLDLKEPGGEDEVPGQFPVAEGGLGVAGRVVVAEDEGGGVVEEGRFHDLAGVDGGGVDVSDALELGRDELILGVHVKDDEAFPVCPADGCPEPVDGLGG